MRRFEFTLKQFWERSNVPIFNAETGEHIDAKQMLEKQDLEVTSFGVKAHFEKGVWLMDGVEVYLESEDE